MERISKKQVEGIFQAFLKTTGRREAESYNDVGAYRLDYAACYGGFNVEKIGNSSGGVGHPFGDNRKPAREMWNALHFAMRAHEDNNAPGTREACEAVMEWARTPGEHGGNPYCKNFVRLAEAAIE